MRAARSYILLCVIRYLKYKGIMTRDYDELDAHASCFRLFSYLNVIKYFLLRILLLCLHNPSYYKANIYSDSCLGFWRKVAEILSAAHHGKYVTVY